MGRHATIRVMGFLVFPLLPISYFFLFTWSVVGNLIYYYPDRVQSEYPSPDMDIDSRMVFAFSHTPIISTFAIDRRENMANMLWINAKKL